MGYFGELKPAKSAIFDDENLLTAHRPYQRVAPVSDVDFNEGPPTAGRRAKQRKADAPKVAAIYRSEKDMLNYERPAYLDYGHRLVIRSLDDESLLMMLKDAKARWGNFVVEGSPAFISRCNALCKKHAINMVSPLASPLGSKAAKPEHVSDVGSASAQKDFAHLDIPTFLRQNIDISARSLLN